MKRRQLLHIALAAALSLTTLSCAGIRTLIATDTPIPPTETPAPTKTPKPTSTPTPIPTEVAYTPVFEPAACPFNVPAGATVDCGYVIVPEDRSDDPTDTVRLAVAVYRSFSDNPAPDPVIYLQGGPGMDSLSWSAGFYGLLVKPVLAERDFIFFDQRGTGRSEPELDCFELKLLFMQDVGRGFPPEGMVERYTNALMMCRDRLVIEGVNLAAYTSADSAADVKDIAAVLGYGEQPSGLFPVNLYGISYGTRLAQAVMRDYPEIVRSAVLDSVVPIDVSLYQDISSEDSLQVLFDGCAADPACSTAYPDLEAVFYDLVEQLDAEPVVVEIPDPRTGRSYAIEVNGARFSSAAVWAMSSSYAIPLIPQAIYQARDGNYEPVVYGMAAPLLMYESLSLGMMISVECHDHAFATTPDALDDLIADFHLTEALGLFSLSGEDVIEICQMWGAAPFDPRDGEPLTSDIPTLVLAGEYDSTTPPLFGRRVAETLSAGYYFEFPGEGHAPSAGGAGNCAQRILLAFLDDPTAEPDSACIAEMEGPDFVVP
jgi:pimeloyl-ACP methyl ester carboxylesterase